MYDTALRLARGGPCRTLAERLVLGALALDPTAAGTWATLGGVAQERTRQQHALIRALHINPKLSAAWVNLGQVSAPREAVPGRHLEC